MAEVVVEGRVTRAPASGTRSGVLLVGVSAAAIVANYVFLLAAGRILGSDAYGSLAALLGLLAVVLVPAGALQMAVSREISRLDAAGEVAQSDAFARAATRLALIATAPLVALALILAAPLSDLLHIHSVGLVAVAELTFVTSLVFPVAMGVLQGRHRFHALAALYLVPTLVRLVLLALFAAAGYRLGGAVVATVIGSIAGTVVAVALIGDPLRSGARSTPPSLRPFLRYLGPVAVGLIGVALLTHIDILIVKARLSAGDAGAYGAASAFARVAFFVPATILAVVFPRTAARQARGEETEDILGRTLLATLGFCTLLVLFYAASGTGLVTASFGESFAQGGEVLAPFALAVGLYSVAQILVGYHLSRGEGRYAWIVASSVLLQIVVLSVVPATLHAVVWANVVIAASTVAAHEVFAGSSVPALRAGLRHFRGAAVRLRAFLPETAIVLIGTTAFACALFWPVLSHFGSTIIGTPGSDSTGSVTDFWQKLHEGGYHVLGTTHHTFSGAPFGWDQTNALNMQVMLAYYPTYLVAQVVGVVAAYNLVTLAGYVLSGATMYVLTRYLGCGRLVSAWAALVFIIFPFHIAHEEHASLIHLEVLALLLLALVAAVRRPSWLRFALVGVANLACWLMSGYFGPMAAVATVAFGLGVALTMNRRRGATFFVGSSAFALVPAAIVGIAAVASGTNGGAGLQRNVSDLAVFGIRPYDLLVPSPANLVVGHHLASFWARHSHGSNGTELTNYLGVLTIALAVTWLVVSWRRRRMFDSSMSVATAGLVAAFVGGVIFAAPSPSVFFGHKITMPSRLLFDVVSAFRVLSRWDFFLMTALVPLAALGLQQVWRALAKRNAPLAVAAVVAAAAFSFFELALHPFEHHFRTVPIPAAYAAVEQTPRGILADYPLAYSDIYRLWQRVQDRPLLNGAPTNSLADQARLMLLDPAQPGTAQALALLGVTAIGIYPQMHVDAEVLPGMPNESEGYKLVGRFADGSSVWDVVATPAPAFAILPGGFSKPMRMGSFVGYPLFTFPGNKVGVIDVRAKQPVVARLVFDVIPPQGARRELRLSGPGHEQAFAIRGRTHISALVEIPRGVSRLLLKVDPAPTSLGDAILISAPRFETATGSPLLQAQSISSDPGF